MYYESNSVKSVIFKPVVRDRQQMQLDRLETTAGSSIPYRSTFWNHPFLIDDVVHLLHIPKLCNEKLSDVRRDIHHIYNKLSIKGNIILEITLAA